jgi:outer membrane protein assembly factor BamB
VAVDGTIFVGTTDGQLVAIGGNGVVRFKRQLLSAPAIVSSPTVSPNGAVLVTVTVRINDTFRSTLFSVSVVNGSINWSQSLPDGYFSTAAPKTWGTDEKLVIILALQSVVAPASAELLILDSAGQFLDKGERCVVVTGGFPVPSDWWRIFTLGLPFTFNPGGLTEDDPIGPLHPSPAVLDRGGSALIILSTSCALIGWEWSPSHLLYRWEQDRDGIDASSPTILGRNTIVVGRYDGTIQAYDADTGTPALSFAADGPVKSTPGGFVNFLYAASLSNLYKIDEGDGSFAASQQLNSPTVASPAVSAQHVYVSTANGLWTFSLDLDPEQFTAIPGGFSSPAIGPDGTVYVATTDNLLRAYH